MIKTINCLIKKFSLFTRVQGQNIKSGSQSALFVPVGHFYSPFPQIAEIKQKEDEIFGNMPKQLPGIELNDQEQISLLDIILVQNNF